MGGKVAKPEVRLAEIAEKQHGVVALEQILRLGLSEKAIRRRVDAGHLHRVHRGVYAVGHPGLSVEGRRFAAVLAVGGGPRDEIGTVLERWGAAVSHRSAASLWGLLPVGSGSSDVVVAGNGGRVRRIGIRVHRSLSLQSADVTLRYGIPVTNTRRTIADLRQATLLQAPGAVSPRELRRATRQAGVLGLPVDDEDAADRTRSDLEQVFLSICKRHELPQPEVNVPIGPFLVDFLWRQQRLVVETDSYRYHRGRTAFQDDRGRELELMRLGYSVLRLSEAQIDEAPSDVGEILGAELGKRRRT